MGEAGMLRCAAWLDGRGRGCTALHGWMGEAGMLHCAAWRDGRGRDAALRGMFGLSVAVNFGFPD
ncbi:hypothetical protein [Paenibacillus piscarius]|uniref:hypothetical protein n=1 Tax=Paenibacillus piscarius TaxID=1089681 RepID=UPI001EE7CC70|nr:hypothetical protein [Paenibacillus piscarius]